MVAFLAGPGPRLIGAGGSGLVSDGGSPLSTRRFCQALMPRLPLPAALLVPTAMAALPVALPASAAPQVTLMTTNITEAQVLQAQRAWCDALLSISRAYRTGGAPLARATADKVLDGAYGYEYGPVAFKPTLTSGQQTFRPTRAGALAYFVGGIPSFLETRASRSSPGPPAPSATRWCSCTASLPSPWATWISPTAAAR